MLSSFPCCTAGECVMNKTRKNILWWNMANHTIFSIYDKYTYLTVRIVTFQCVAAGEIRRNIDTSLEFLQHNFSNAWTHGLLSVNTHALWWDWITQCFNLTWQPRNLQHWRIPLEMVCHPAWHKVLHRCARFFTVLSVTIHRLSSGSSW
jgi:hypothetical protein